MMLHLSGAGGGNELSQGLAANAGERKVDDVGVAKEVIKERFDRSQCVRTTQLKQNYPHTAVCLRHSLGFPRTGEFTLIRGQSQCGNESMERREARQDPPRLVLTKIRKCKFYGKRNSACSGTTTCLRWPSCQRSEERRVGKECRSRWSPY